MSVLTGIIIVTYNGMQWIDRCLGSVVSRDSHRVFVVDNGSSDGTPDYIRIRFPGVHLIQPGNNLGFGIANNLGIAEAIRNGVEAVFLLNQDAWVAERSIAKLVTVQNRHPQFGVVSPIHLNGAGDAPDIQFERYCKDSGLDIARSYEFQKGELPLFPVNFVNAAGWLVSGDCLRRVGGFHPAFFMYGEDTEYVSRLRMLGYQVGVCPEATMFHDRAGRAERDKTESEVYFFGVRATITLCGNRFEKALKSGAQNLKVIGADPSGNKNVTSGEFGVMNLQSGKRKITIYNTKCIIDELYKPFLLNILRSPIRSMKILLQKIAMLYRLRKKVKSAPVTIGEYRYLNIILSEDQ